MSAASYTSRRHTGLLLELVFKRIGDVRVILLAGRVAALSLQTSELASARTRHDKPRYAGCVVCVCPARLKHKAAAAPLHAPSDLVQTDKTCIGVAAISHQLLTGRLTLDPASECLRHDRVRHLGSWNFIPRLAIPGLLIPAFDGVGTGCLPTHEISLSSSGLQSNPLSIRSPKVVVLPPPHETECQAQCPYSEHSTFVFICIGKMRQRPAMLFYRALASEEGRKER